MRLAVTGAGGGLGRAFLAHVASTHEVRAFTREELDVGDQESVMRTIGELEPELVLNFAAFTRVDACETEPERAYAANALGPHALALAARRCGAVLVHVSTDYVFDGEKDAPYDERDRPRPLSVYGRSKLAGESLVRQTLPEHFVVRTGYVFGGGADYLSGALRRLARGEPAGGVEDRTGSPTFVRDLAARMLPLVQTRRFGTYHLAGPEATTWFDVLERAREIGGLPGPVTPQRSDDLGLPAPRPRNSSMRSVLAAEAGVEPLGSIDEGIAELLRDLSGSVDAR